MMERLVKEEQQILITSYVCCLVLEQRTQPKRHLYCVHCSWEDTDNHQINKISDYGRVFTREMSISDRVAHGFGRCHLNLRPVGKASEKQEACEIYMLTLFQGRAISLSSTDRHCHVLAQTRPPYKHTQGSCVREEITFTVAEKRTIQTTA